MTGPDQRMINRWRMALGRSADARLDAALDGTAARLDAALEVVYGRGVRNRRRQAGAGTLEPAQITLPTWLGELRALFPASMFEIIQSHAIDRFGMSELLADPALLGRLEPNRDLLKVLLAFKGRVDPKLADMVRGIIAKVVAEITAALRPRVLGAFSGSRHRFARTNLKTSANFDLRRTIRANLDAYDPQRRALVARRLVFSARQRRHLPWTIILCVDQSGSMLNSLIHATILAAILAGLPAVAIRFIVFDTDVIDLSDQIGDPVDLLLSVQLGGGTDIAKALTYCETLVTQPSRTILALISDFAEGGSVAALLRVVRRMASSRVTQIGLAALDGTGSPAYNHDIAEKLTASGMTVAVLAPDRFAEWLAGVMV